MKLHEDTKIEILTGTTNSGGLDNFIKSANTFLKNHHCDEIKILCPTPLDIMAIITYRKSDQIRRRDHIRTYVGLRQNRDRPPVAGTPQGDPPRVLESSPAGSDRCSTLHDGH